MSPFLCLGNSVLRFVLTKNIVSTIMVVINSAKGSASHSPSSFRKCSSKNMLDTAKTPVLSNEIMPEVIPSDTAVNNPDDTILTPINR